MGGPMGRVDQPHRRRRRGRDGLDLTGKLLVSYATSFLNLALINCPFCQYHSASSTRIHLFGQILAALYQNDIVEEEDIRNWHALPEAKGEDVKDQILLENLQKTWIVGARMIHQFNEQDSDDDEGESGSSEAEEDDAD
jgi:hypothetical protein